MEFEPKKVAEIAKAYFELKQSQDCFYCLDFEHRRHTAWEVKQKLVHYLATVPDEIRTDLDIDVSKLEVAILKAQSRN